MTSNPSRPQLFRGDLWWADLNPVRGHEESGRRPVLIISDDNFNASRLNMIAVLPITKTLRGWPSRVLLTPPEGGIRVPSEIAVDQLRFIDIERLGTPLGSSPVSPATLSKVETVLRVLLQL